MEKKKIFLLILLLFFLFFLKIKAENFSFNFYREVFDGNENETVNGILFLKDSIDEKGVYFYVTRPVNQILTYNEIETTIYYPEEKKAFIIIENKPVKLNTMDVTKKIDLRQLDFILSKIKKEKDSITEKWVPKNIAGFPIKEIEKVTDKKGRIKKLEIKDKKEKIIWQVKYDNYFKIKEKDIPFIVETYSSFDNNFFQERIVLSKPVVNPQMPDIIKKFEIPRDAVIKKVKM